MNAISHTQAYMHKQTRIIACKTKCSDRSVQPIFCTKICNFNVDSLLLKTLCTQPCMKHTTKYNGHTHSSFLTPFPCTHMFPGGPELSFNFCPSQLSYQSVPLVPAPPFSQVKQAKDVILVLDVKTFPFPKSVGLYRLSNILCPNSHND